MKKYIVLFVLFLGHSIMSQELDSLLLDKNSHSILKESETELSILDKKHFIFKKHYKIIIKNKFADELKRVSIYYDDFRKVKKANVTVRDLEGTVIEEYKLNDFEDRVYDYSNIDSDSRYKVLSPPITTYPFEVEVSYEVNNSASLFYSVWQPQYDKMSVIDARLKVVDYTQNNLRFHSKNAQEPQIKTQEGSKTYTWQLSNAKPIEYESYNTVTADYFTTVFLAPKRFEMDGYTGDLSDWKSFGSWINTLNSSRNNLSEVHEANIYSLKLKKESPTETIKSIYRYLQQTTRYISIQIGIGGYQPFETAQVHEEKYGDCKGLSFYTQSLLALFGIKSYYTLINAGKRAKSLNEDFSDARFNHAILTVPIEKDTIFLECTSQTVPFGYAGTFTGNRKALMIDGSQSKIISTKKYSPSDNLHKTITQIDLNLEESSSNVIINKTLEGTEIEHKGFLFQQQESDLKKKHWVLDNFEWGEAIEIDRLLFKKIIGDTTPKSGFDIVFTNRKEIMKRGDRIFLSPKKYLSKKPKVPKETTRKTPIRIRFGYQAIDTVRYELNTSNYSIENKQEDVVIESEFGSYKRSVEKTEKQIILHRFFQLEDGVYDPSEYEKFKDFLKQVRRSDSRKIILHSDS